MASKCELTDHTLQFGNKVSHSNRKTTKVFLPNLQKTGFFSAQLDKMVRFKASVKTIRSIDKHGGIDNFLLNTADRKLPKKAQQFKKTLLKLKSN